MTLAVNSETPGMPDMAVSVRQLFGIDTDLEAPGLLEGG